MMPLSTSNMNSTNKESFSVSLQSGKELTLSISEDIKQLDSCHLEYDLNLPGRSSCESDAEIGSTPLTVSSEKVRDREECSQPGPPNGCTHPVPAVSKKEALHGLVKAVVYLETVSVFSGKDVESLWAIYERINSLNIDQQYLSDLGEVSNDILVANQKRNIVVDKSRKKISKDECISEIEDDANEFDMKSALSMPSESNDTKLKPADSTDIVIEHYVLAPDSEDFTENVLSENNYPYTEDNSGDNNTNTHDLPDTLQVQHVEAKVLTEKKYRCEECHKRFNKRYLYKAHMRMHEGIHPFTCRICDRIYRTSSAYRAHMERHKDGNHQCHICGKSFYRIGLLSTHMRSHDKVKRYVCVICGKRSSTSSNNISHMKTHSDERTSQCNICGKSFRRNNDMKKHQRNHHPGSMFKP